MFSHPTRCSLDLFCSSYGSKLLLFGHVFCILLLSSSCNSQLHIYFQMITLPPSGSLDKKRTFRMAAYGLLILGPSQHLWFNFLSKILPKQDIVTIMKKIVGGQVIYGPSITTIFFSYNAILRGKQKFCMDYSFQTLYHY